MEKKSKTRIIIVGGGAGGLELTARLTKLLRRHKNVEITLVDKQLKHIWKPLLHEVSAGTIPTEKESVDYLTYAYDKGCKFILGAVKQINHEAKTLTLFPYYSEEKVLLLPERTIPYDLLVLAMGSQVNDFNTPGVQEQCILLNDVRDAELLNQKIINKIILNTQQANIPPIEISIIGAGATGVELAAELQFVLSKANRYAKHNKNSLFDFQITLIEASDRILNMMPERISQAVHHSLSKNGIKILEGVRVTEITKDQVLTEDKRKIPSLLTIWAAGVKGNSIPIHDLEMNHIQQFLVNEKLQSTTNPSIFAMGDCAACPQLNKEGGLYFVPPRAQAAHQQAKVLAKSLTNLVNSKGKGLVSFHYKDYGSIIKLSQYNVVGNLMSKAAKNFYIEGMIARFSYWLLYQKHLIVIKGFWYTVFNAITNLILQNQKPEIKLH